MQPENVISALATGDNFDNALFQIAISVAEDGRPVWFISPDVFERAPRNIKTPDKEVLQLITFMYLKDDTDLLKQMNGIHLWRKLPSFIIIKDFERYCNFSSSDYNPLQAALITTSLLDSAAVCAKRNNEKIFLLVCCSNGVGKNRLQIINDLYFINYFHKEDDTEFCNNVSQVFK